MLLGPWALNFSQLLKLNKNKFQAFSGQVNYIVGIVEVLYMNTLYISVFYMEVLLWMFNINIT